MNQADNNSEKLCHVLHGFLEPDRQLFAHFHAPAGKVRETAWVICAPLGYEGVHCHHTLKMLGDTLAAAGCATMRIHYDGTGESRGSDADPGRVAAWLASIEKAMDALEALAPIRRVGLIGIRMGATLAAAVASRREAAGLVLWEPCVSGAMYVREMEIMASATAKQLEAEAGAVPDVPGVPEGLQAGGYLVTPETRKDLGELNLPAMSPLGHPRTLLLPRSDRPANAQLQGQLESAGFDVTVEQVPGHKEMMAGAHPMSSVVPDEIVSRVRDWAIEGNPESDISGADIRPALAPETREDGLVRRTVFFGRDQQLFGMLTEPEGGTTPGTPDVVLYSGGVVPRTAVNRMYVALAGALARTGRRVLRLDVSGIGESPPAPGNRHNEIFPTSMLPDARAALDFLADGNAEHEFWIAGLCSGAATTFQTAVADPRIKGAVMINIAAFYWEPGVAPDAMDVKQFSESQHYRQSMFSIKSWLKLVSGKVNLLHIFSLLASRVSTFVASRWSRTSLFGLKRAEGLAPDIERLLGRGTRVNLVFSPGDYSYELLTGLAGSRLGRLQKRGLVIRHFQGADHTFNPLGARLELIDWIVGQVTGGREGEAGITGHESPPGHTHERATATR